MQRRHQISSALVFIIIMGSIILACNKTEKMPPPYIIILSVDGFRWDYPDSTATPALDYLAENGVKALSLKPSYPTKTFPNHYSIATGLYPDNHGIIHNTFFAPDLNLLYTIGNKEVVHNPAFYKGEPLWVTAEKQGIISASYYWVASESHIGGIDPTYCMIYEHEKPFEDRANQVVEWLQLPEEKRPHLSMWYLHEPDATGHDFGPHSKEIYKNVQYLDSLIGDFTRKIEALPIANEINLIVLSDHGMGKLSPDRIVYLDKIIPDDIVENIYGGNPIFYIAPKPDMTDSIMNILKATEHIKAWKKEELPEHYNFGKNQRIPAIIAEADSAWSLTLTTDNYANMLGTHGYDNNNTDMHAIFYAKGPAFKNNYKHFTFENVDIYNLICKILNIKPAPNDGKPERINGILKK